MGTHKVTLSQQWSGIVAGCLDCRWTAAGAQAPVLAAAVEHTLVRKN